VAECLACGGRLDDTLAQVSLVHASCFRPVIEREPENEAARKQILEVVRYADDNSTRSLQKTLGPSEIGHTCDRRIGYGLAGIREVNFRSDPFAAIAGTALHGWMERAIEKYQREVRNLGWQSELELHVDDLVTGHTDVYVEPDVWDWKFPSSAVLKEYRENGVPSIYQVQGQLYGYGHRKAGRPVRDIVLIFTPRDGRLRDMWFWREPYDQDIATRALGRMYSIAYKLIELDIHNHPERWDQIPALAERKNCWYCPFFVERDAELKADGTGCPGYSEPAAIRTQKAKEAYEKRLYGDN